MTVIGTMTACAFAAAQPVFANPRIVVDVQSGRVIEHEDAFRRWYPASLTKLMTAYVAFNAVRSGQLSMESLVTMSKRAADQPASKMYYKPGQQMTLDSALKMLLIKSANDIAVAIAETVGGSQEAFVDRMNQQALALGMTSSHFVNPNGLPGKGQYTTARDLAVLAVAIKRDFPEYSAYFSYEGFSTGKKNYPNYNLLIGRFDGADGMKTGFICASGFNQVSSATRDGRTVVSVVLGTESLGARADMSADLLQKALTTAPSGNLTLRTLQPYGADRDTVADISADICSAKGKKVRSEGRDEVGRMKMHSPYIHEMTSEPKFVFAGLVPGSEVKQDKTASAAGTVNVPIPIPRPATF